MTKMEELTFVNVLGDVISKETLKPVKKVRKPGRERPAEYHNGWRVQGIPPGVLEEARATYKRESDFARQQGKQPKDWNEENWLMNAKRKPVRSKPYEVPQAAEECKAMAEKAGWLRVEVVELKKSKEQA